MKLRTILFCVVALAALSAVVYLVRRPAAPTVADDRVGKPLVEAGVVDNAAKLQVHDQGKSVTLTRGADGKWVVSDYYDFPADFAKLTRFTNELVEAKLQRLVTTNPERINRLEFNNTKIELQDAAGKQLWAATLGKAAETGGRFVRFGTEQKAYLANLSTWLDTEPKNWADSALVAFKPEDISRVELGFGDGSVVVATRAKKEDPWKADPTPANQIVNAEKLNAVLTSLSALRFSDTTALNDVNAAAAQSHQRTVKLTTFDGKNLQLTFGRKPEEKKLKPPSATTAGNGGPGTLGSITDLAAKAPGAKPEEPAAGPKTITPEYETIPAGPVFVTINSSDPTSPVNGMMQKRAFEVSDHVFTGLPQNSSELFSAAPAATAAPSPAVVPPSTETAPKS